MQYTAEYLSPLGEILLAADDTGLTGLWFSDGKYFAEGLGDHTEKAAPALDLARRWLDCYFRGKDPGFMPPLHLIGSPFQTAVWELLLKIPYGEVTTYGAIAKEIAARHGGKMSAQAVGGAVGHNKISIIIPCHRVVGTNFSLTGYGGGISKKRYLLALEGVAVERFTLPKKGTAL